MGRLNARSGAGRAVVSRCVCGPNPTYPTSFFPEEKEKRAGNRQTLTRFSSRRKEQKTVGRVGSVGRTYGYVALLRPTTGRPPGQSVGLIELRRSAPCSYALGAEVCETSTPCGSHSKHSMFGTLQGLCRAYFLRCQL